MTTTHRALPLIERIRIASPCDVPWADMRGDDQVRHCDRCDKNVYDLSSLTRAEVERLLATHDDPCLTYFRRADGTVLLADCPVGVQRRRRRWSAFSALAVGTLASVVGLFAASTTAATAVTPEPCDNAPAARRRPEPSRHDEPVVSLADPPPEVRSPSPDPLDSLGFADPRRVMGGPIRPRPAPTSTATTKASVAEPDHVR